MLAIHNYSYVHIFIFKLQTLLQSYQNVSNSQLIALMVLYRCSCKRFCKVIKMLAIHNYHHMLMKFFIAANAFAKLSKCQQFTTYTDEFMNYRQLQTLLQSYQNVSNSQQSVGIIFMLVCCKRFCKVIKMLAIHNSPEKRAESFNVANAYAKLSKCQQFTTHHSGKKMFTMLQTLMQSYQNVSNSQPIKGGAFFCEVANAYAKLSKCQQFTTRWYSWQW